MVDKRLIEEWLDKADQDNGFASSVIDDSPYYAQICFHYQQSAEKIAEKIKMILQAGE